MTNTDIFFMLWLILGSLSIIGNWIILLTEIRNIINNKKKKKRKRRLYMEDMKYTEALRKLFEVMEGRPDIKEVKFNRENDSFEVIDEARNCHVCFGDEFRNKEGGHDK